MRLSKRYYEVRELRILDVKRLIRKFRVKRVVVAVLRASTKGPSMQRCHCHLHQNLIDRVEIFISRMPYHALFGFLIPLLIGILQVNSQGTSKSSFDTHPANMWAFLMATFIYCFAFAADMKSQLHNTGYSQLSSLAAVISGSLSSVSLVSVFISRLLGRLVFVIWSLLTVILARGLIKHACLSLYQMIMKTFFQVVGIWNRFKGSKSMDQPRSLV